MIPKVLYRPPLFVSQMMMLPSWQRDPGDNSTGIVDGGSRGTRTGRVRPALERQYPRARADAQAMATRAQRADEIVRDRTVGAALSRSVELQPSRCFLLPLDDPRFFRVALAFR